MAVKIQPLVIDDAPRSVAKDGRSDAGLVEAATQSWGREISAALRSLSTSVQTLQQTTPSPTPSATPATLSSVTTVIAQAGENGWTPQFALVPVSGMAVLQLVGWIGGTGTVPASGMYVGPSGFVATPAFAVNLSGPSGSTGGLTMQMVFSAGVTAPPGTGNVLFDNVTFGSIANIQISTTDRNSVDISATLARLGIGSLIEVFQENSSIAFATFVVTAATAHTGYLTLAVLPLSGQVLTDLQPVGFSFTSSASNTTIINAISMGADPTGVIDSGPAVVKAIAAATPDGTISNLILRRYISGFGLPNPTPSVAWAARPAVVAVGGLGTGFAAVGNINSQGYMVGFEIDNQGTGYAVLPMVVNRTNGSPVITLASAGVFDARLVAGVSVRHESISNGATVLSRNLAGTQLTLSENMTFTNADTFVFGLPWITVAGTPYYDLIIPVLGRPKAIVFPPGNYLLAGGLSVWAGLSNLTVHAEGADFMCTSVGIQGIWLRMSTGIRFNGGKFKFPAAKFQVPSSRTRYPGAEGIIIGTCQEVTFFGTEVHDAFDFSIVVGGGGVANRPLCSRVNLLDVTTVNGLGDGIHFTAGTVEGRVSRARILMPGDDALAVVNDGATAQPPDDILFEDCTVEGGLYRGCVAIGCTRVTWRNIKGRDTHGPFCWAAADGGTAAPSDISFLNISARNLGNTAISTSDTNSGQGIFADTMDRLVVRNLTFTQDASVLGNNPVYNVQATVTNLDSDQDEIESIGTGTTAPAAVNTDYDTAAAGAGYFAGITLNPGRWVVDGSITARSSTSAANVMWAVFFDGTTEYGRASSLQTSDLAYRAPLACHGFINVPEGTTKSIRFKVKQGGGGITLDVGSVSGPNSSLRAIRRT